MKRVLIVDDESLARSIVKEFLSNEHGYEVVGECGNGFEAIKAIEQLKPDLVFLDIQMPKITGFEMLEIIDDPPPVIFTTAFDEYAVRAFEFNAIDYLLKPFAEDRFIASIRKFESSAIDMKTGIQNFLSTNDSGMNRIVIKNNNEIIILPLDKVTHVEAYDDYVKVHTSDKSYLKKKTMNFYEENLPKSHFVRIHRSYIINVNYLTKIESFEKNKFIAKLGNDVQIPISRASYPNLREMLGV